MGPQFPELRDLADRASTVAQKRYVWLNIGQLFVMITAAVLASFSPTREHARHAESWAICVLMAVALTCSAAIKVGKFEVRWFKCRAFAENAKNLVWRFVTSSESNCDSPEQSYITEWGRLLQRIPEIRGEYGLSSEKGELITQWMRSSQSLALEDKVTLYREGRLGDQIRWYARNSRKNARIQARWFWALFIIQATAIAVAACQAWLLLSVNLTGVFAALASAMVAWMQLKRYSDLSTSYSVAAEDLTLISERFRAVTDQSTMNTFVESVEDAISREHSMWLARRNC